MYISIYGKKDVCKHDISLSWLFRGIEMHARSSHAEMKREVVHTFTSLNSRQSAEVTALDGNLYASSPRATMVCKRDSIIARHGKETASPLAFLPFFLFPSSFLPPFFPPFLRYIYVAISGSSIEIPLLPRMSELSEEKQTVYLRRSSLMHNSGIVCPSTRLSRRKEAVDDKNSHVQHARRYPFELSDAPASIASQIGLDGKFVQCREINLFAVNFISLLQCNYFAMHYSALLDALYD